MPPLTLYMLLSAAYFAGRSFISRDTVALLLYVSVTRIT